MSERESRDPGDVTRIRIVDRRGQFNVVRRGLARSLSTRLVADHKPPYHIPHNKLSARGW